MTFLAIFFALCGAIVTYALGYDAGHAHASSEILDQLERSTRE
jgi:membrane protein YqaA with SNARE-associated domain